MIISLILLAPLATVLLWLYGRSRPRGLNGHLLHIDRAIPSLAALLTLAATWSTHAAMAATSGIWPYVVAPLVGYAVLLGGLLCGLLLRFHHHASRR